VICLYGKARSVIFAIQICIVKLKKREYEENLINVAMYGDKFSVCWSEDCF
jgi:hypothetical protein